MEEILKPTTVIDKDTKYKTKEDISLRYIVANDDEQDEMDKTYHEEE